MEQEKNKIQFRPLTQGLGFHPFSDGLPYAPVSKAAQRPQATPHTPQTRDTKAEALSQGAGAVSAGQPGFVYPSPAKTKAPSPRISVPVAKNAARPFSQPLKAKAQPQILLRKDPTPAASASPAFGQPRYGVLYLLKRILAYGIDTILNMSLLATGLSFALLNENMSPDLLMNPGVILISVLFFILFNWALVTAQEIAFGTSVGKRIFGLNISGSTSALFLRAFFFLPSLGFCGLGLLWGLFDSRKRCWHDLVVNIQPTEVARL